MTRICALIFAAFLVNSNPALAIDCADADPGGVQGEVYGNFQLHADPDDPAHNVIYINHTHDGPAQIVVARVDGVTGRFEPDSLTVVANNFQGKRVINGPEFVYPPGSGLGIVYRDLDGVHGVFRPAGAAQPAWNAFMLTVYGQPATQYPPKLPATDPLSYDYGGLPFGQNTYTLYQPPCSELCFANMRVGVPTDAGAVFRKENLYPPSLESMVQGTSDGDVLAYLCSQPKTDTNNTCGLYGAAIDTQGGFTTAPVLLQALPKYYGPMPLQVPVAVKVHPASRANIVFVAASHESGGAIDIYQQANDSSPLSLIGSVPAQDDQHYRIVDDGQSMLVLNYLVMSGNLKGSYTVVVHYSPDQGYKITGPNRIDQPAGAEGRPEVEYFPAVGKFAIYYRVSQQPSKMMRCFFSP